MTACQKEAKPDIAINAVSVTQPSGIRTKSHVNQRTNVVVSINANDTNPLNALDYQKEDGTI